MAIALPIIAAFASGAVGAVVAGTATFAAYASVAGAVLSTVGALSGSKDLQRIGGFVALAGGISALAGGSSVAQAGAADYVNGADLASDQASAAAAASDAGASSAGAVNGMDLQSDQASSLYGRAQTEIPGAPTVDPNQPGPIGSDSADPGTDAWGSGDESGKSIYDLGTRGEGLRTGDLSGQRLGQPMDAISKAASNTSGVDLQAWFDRAANAGKAIGDFATKNPSLLAIGGNILNGMYGPAARKFDWEKSLMERAQSNYNAPVVLRYNGGK